MLKVSYCDWSMSIVRRLSCVFMIINLLVCSASPELKGVLTQNLSIVLW